MDQILQSSWTVSIAVPSVQTIEADIQTTFNKIDPVTLIGPTTSVLIIRIKTASSNAAPSGEKAASRGSFATTGNTATALPISGTETSSTETSSGPLSQNYASAIRLSSVQTSTSSTAAGNKMSTTAPPAVMGMGPDSYMATQYSKAYANVTYTPPAYNPVSVSPDECVLWDYTREGNRTLAADKFFGVGGYNGTMFALIGDSCFDEVDSVASGTNCTSSLLNPASTSFSPAAKSYIG